MPTVVRKAVVELAADYNRSAEPRYDGRCYSLPNFATAMIETFNTMVASLNLMESRVNLGAALWGGLSRHRKRFLGKADREPGMWRPTVPDQSIVDSGQTAFS